MIYKSLEFLTWCLINLDFHITCLKSNHFYDCTIEDREKKIKNYVSIAASLESIWGEMEVRHHTSGALNEPHIILLIDLLFYGCGWGLLHTVFLVLEKKTWRSVLTFHLKFEIKKNYPTTHVISIFGSAWCLNCPPYTQNKP